MENKIKKKKGYNCAWRKASSNSSKKENKMHPGTSFQCSSTAAVVMDNENLDLNLMFITM